MLRRSFVIIPVSNFYEDNISKKKNIHPAIWPHWPSFPGKKSFLNILLARPFLLQVFWGGGSIKYSYSFYNLEGVLYFALSRESSLQHINAIYAGRIEQTWPSFFVLNMFAFYFDLFSFCLFWKCFIVHSSLYI